jgi:hypothetical protein
MKTIDSILNANGLFKENNKDTSYDKGGWLLEPTMFGFILQNGMEKARYFTMFTNCIKRYMAHLFYLLSKPDTISLDQ